MEPRAQPLLSYLPSRAGQLPLPTVLAECLGREQSQFLRHKPARAPLFRALPLSSSYPHQNLNSFEGLGSAAVPRHLSLTPAVAPPSSSYSPLAHAVPNTWDPLSFLFGSYMLSTLPQSPQEAPASPPSTAPPSPRLHAPSVTCVSPTSYPTHWCVCQSPHFHHSDLSAPHERPLPRNYCSPESDLPWVLIACALTNRAEETQGHQCIPALQECRMTTDTRPQEMPREVKASRRRSGDQLLCLGCA